LFNFLSNYFHQPDQM